MCIQQEGSPFACGDNEELPQKVRQFHLASVTFTVSIAIRLPVGRGELAAAERPCATFLVYILSCLVSLPSLYIVSTFQPPVLLGTPLLPKCERKASNFTACQLSTHTSSGSVSHSNSYTCSRSQSHLWRPHSLTGQVQVKLFQTAHLLGVAYA